MDQLILLILLIAAAGMFLRYYKGCILLDYLPDIDVQIMQVVKKHKEEYPMTEEEAASFLRSVRTNTKMDCVFWGTVCMFLAFGLCIN